MVTMLKLLEPIVAVANGLLYPRFRLGKSRPA